MTYAGRIAILCGLSVLAIIGALFIEPIAQDPAYHNFADQRALLGISNFGDVVSNAGFLMAGLIGLAVVAAGRQSRKLFERKFDVIPYVVFFTGVTAVSAGSAYYHEMPANGRLFWDRLPMTVAFMGLTAALIADRINARFGIRFALPALIVVGILSLFYWEHTEQLGRGDLRFYALVQFLPIVLIPIICGLFPNARYTGQNALFPVIVWYLIAKGLEHFDHQVFDMLGQTISGHSLKHLAAAVACYMVLRMLRFQLRHG
jgi:hypothetical protein